jgi:hypothetical protein
MSCEAITAEGRPCLNQAKLGYRLCGTHLNQRKRADAIIEQIADKHQESLRKLADK